MEIYINKTVEEMAEKGYMPMLLPGIMALPITKVRVWLDQEKNSERKRIILEEIVDQIMKFQGVANPTSAEFIAATVLVLNNNKYSSEGNSMGNNVFNPETKERYIPMLHYKRKL